MKIRVLSDLHLEHRDWVPPPVSADLVVLAGDIHIGGRGLLWAREHFPGTPLIYVPGNHEYYGGKLQDVLSQLREEARRSDIHLLDKDEVTVAGVRFLGATLWTDFELHGSDLNSLGQAMHEAQYAIEDFRIVRYGNEGPLRPVHVRQIHFEQVRWLNERLGKPVSEPTVVVTHHLPHRRSVHPRFVGQPCTPAFASDLGWLVKPPVTLWIHGHTHESMDYVANGTRVVCNPRGYVPIEPNPDFDPLFTVDVPADTSVAESIP